MKLRESRHGHIHALHLEGEVDLHCAPALRSVFEAKAACRYPYLILDLSAVEHIDSTGIALLIEYQRDATLFDGFFGVVSMNDHVRSIFSVVQLDKVIPVFDNIEQAKCALRDGLVAKPERALFGEEDDTQSSPATSAVQLRGSEEALEVGSIDGGTFGD